MTSWAGRFTRWAAIAVLGAVTVGCGGGSGSDGSPGSAGEPGAPGPVRTEVATALQAEITDVSVPADGKPVVTFSVEDQFGVPFVGVVGGNVRFTIAQLQADDNGNRNWQNYINSAETPSGGGPIVDATQKRIQGTFDSGGSLVDNGNGTYTYTFGKVISPSITTTSGSATVTVTYDADLTHRVGMQLSGVSGVTKPTNAVYTWQPSSGATDGIAGRDIVKTDSCNSCHTELTVHGSRVETKYCVTCHNPGSSDADSGNSVDFKVMIHKIHRSAGLPSVLNGETYSIWGYGGFGKPDAEYAFSDVQFPQDIRNCTKCHDSADVAATPQAINWESKPSIEACGSCHDDRYFTDEVPAELWKVQHSGGARTNAECSGCHDGSDAAAGTIAAKHVPSVAEGTKKYQVNILGVTGTLSGTSTIGAGDTAVVNFEIVDPTNGNARRALTDVEWTAGAALTLRIAYDASEYTGRGDTNLLTAGVSTLQGDGTYNATTAAMPASGSVTVLIYGYVQNQAETGAMTNRASTLDKVNVQPAFTTVAVADATPTARRVVVSAAKCDNCHQNARFGVNHGQYSRAGDPQVCATCHNPTRTSSNAANVGVRSSTDWKRVVHGLHASASHGGDPFRETPYRASFSAYRFPGKLSQCGNCHEGDSYTLPLADEVAGSLLAGGNLITPTAAVCSSCHDSAVADAHMKDNGASIDETTDISAVVESCVICHGDGRVADVKVVHGIE